MEEVKETAHGEVILASDLLVFIMKYLDLDDILTSMILVNKATYKKIKEENFVMFKKFIRTLNIPFSYEMNDLPAREDIFSVFKRVHMKVRKNELEDLTPFAYYTNGGTY